MASPRCHSDEHRRAKESRFVFAVLAAAEYELELRAQRQPEGIVAAAARNGRECRKEHVKRLVSAVGFRRGK
ncbi:MAG: hypothetical protein JO132_14710 [Streptosporangiaceae bacterium]|nr:hypothetical protein [Streptosporangiaceae bacterium]